MRFLNNKALFDRPLDCSSDRHFDRSPVWFFAARHGAVVQEVGDGENPHHKSYRHPWNSSSQLQLEIFFKLLLFFILPYTTSRRRSDIGSKDLNDMQVIRNHAPPTELTDYYDVTNYIDASHHYHHQPHSTHCSPYHHYRHHQHSQSLANSEAHSLCTPSSPPIINHHAFAADEVNNLHQQHQQQHQQLQQQLQQHQQLQQYPCKLKHKLENGEYTHVWQLEKQQQQSNNARITDPLLKDTSTFKPYSKTNINKSPGKGSNKNTNFSSNNSDSNNNGNSSSDNNKKSADVCPSYTAVNKTTPLQHPSLLQDHVIRVLSSNDDKNVCNHKNPNDNNNNVNKSNNNKSKSIIKNTNNGNSTFLSFDNEEYKNCEIDNETTTTTICENNNNNSTCSSAFPKLQNYYA